MGYSFEIITDSPANLPEEMIDKYGLHILSLSFIVEGQSYKGYEKGKTVDLNQFYGMMRDKKDIKTSLANTQDALDLMEPLLKEGKDLLYICFSSGLSSTYQAVNTAFEELREDYPDRKMYLVDSLCAALGEGLLVKHVLDQREKGLSIDETAKWAEEHKLNIVHAFTVDDLFFLKRGGRISATTAVVGTALNIKPVLHVDNEGRLVSTGKARGRKKSLDMLVQMMEKHVENPEGQTIYISHGDCLEDAEYVAKKVKEKFPVGEVMIHTLDPVIGAHSGPGTVALFFYGNIR